MIDHESDDVSATQADWMDLAAAIRTHLQKRAKTMPEMDLDAIERFVNLSRNAFWLECNACYMDRTIELERSREEPDDD